jgi:methyl-accepting chemotaxis protein
VTELAFRNSSAFRARTQLGRTLVGGGVAGLIALYLAVLLELTASQWNWLFQSVGIFAVVCVVGSLWWVERTDASVRDAIDADAKGKLDRDLARRAFRSASRYPLRGVAYSLVVWASAAALLPLAMVLRFSDFPLTASLSVAVAAACGGVIAALFNYYADKRLVEPLLERWGERIPDPAERRSLVRTIRIAVKLRIAMTAVLVAGVALSVILSDALARRPVEAYATRIQQGWLERMVERIDGPGDPVLRLAREDLVELGLASELLLVDVERREIVDGASDVLSAAELAWIAGGAPGPTSVGLDSAHTFAWRALEFDDAHVLVAVTPREVLTGDFGRVRAIFVGLALVAALVGLAAAHQLALDVSGTAARLRKEAERIASGDLTRGTPIESEDELGELAHSFERMSGSLRVTVGRVAEAADAVEVAAGELAAGSASVADAATEQGRALQAASSSMGSIHAEVSGITESVQVLNINVEEASSSVLELGAAGEELKHTASALSAQVESVSASIEQMTGSAREIAEHTEGLSNAAAETSSSMTEMAASMRDVDANAGETARLSAQVVSLADAGRSRVRETIEGMDVIRTATETMESVIGGLGSRVKEIGAIVDVIDDVADETSLLALNAAIIAAQAGDQGRAFSVVADEIAGLAERVLTSTKEIGSLIRDVQEESARAVRTIETGARNVQQGVRLAAEAGVSLEEITSASRASGDRIEEIVGAVREQSAAAGHVAQLMESVSEGVGQIRQAGLDHERGTDAVSRSSAVMRDVAQQVHRTTEEQARGAARIRDSVESVREAVERMHESLRQQSAACDGAVGQHDQIQQRTHSNEESARQMSEATQRLKVQAEALRQDVGRFRI